MARREDRRGSELPSLERLVTLTTLLLGRLAVETSDWRSAKKKWRRAKKKGIGGVEEIKFSTFVSLEKCHVYCHIRNYGKKYSFYFRLSNILKTKNVLKIYSSKPLK